MTTTAQLLARCVDAFAGMPHVLEKISNRYRYKVAPIPILPELRHAAPTRISRIEVAYAAGRGMTAWVTLWWDELEIHVGWQRYEALVWYTREADGTAETAVRFADGTDADVHHALVALCTVALRYGHNATTARIAGYPAALRKLGKRAKYVGQAIRKLERQNPTGRV